MNNVLFDFEKGLKQLLSENLKETIDFLTDLATRNEKMCLKFIKLTTEYLNKVIKIREIF